MFLNQYHYKRKLLQKIYKIPLVLLFLPESCIRQKHQKELKTELPIPILFLNILEKLF